MTVALLIRRKRCGSRLIEIRHVDVFLSELALCLLRQLATALAGQDVLAVFVKVQLGDDNLGGVDANLNLLAIVLVARNVGNVDDVLLPVDLGDLALTVLELSTHDSDFIALANGNRADLTAANIISNALINEQAEVTYVVFLAKVLRKRRAHDLTPGSGVGGEVRLARLRARGTNSCSKSHWPH